MNKYMVTYEFRPPEIDGLQLVQVWQVFDDYDQRWVWTYLSRRPVVVSIPSNDEYNEQDFNFDNTVET